MCLAGCWPADDLDVLDHALHPDSALVDRVDLATPLSSSFRLALASRLLPPRSGLERSDFVPWPISAPNQAGRRGGYWGYGFLAGCEGWRQKLTHKRHSAFAARML
jgi:hypothetical protein